MQAASSEHFTAFTDAQHVNNLEYSKFVAGEERPGERRPLPCPSPSSGRRYGDIPSAVSTLTVPLFFFFETGVLRKLEAFREKLKAVLHAAGHQTLHPLLQTRLMLHFVDRLDSSTLNVFKATPAKPTYQPSPTLPPLVIVIRATGPSLGIVYCF